MTNFFYGILFMYLMALPLLLYIAEPEDPENDPGAAWRFALMWPVAALECLFRILLGNTDGN